VIYSGGCAVQSGGLTPFHSRGPLFDMLALYSTGGDEILRLLVLPFISSSDCHSSVLPMSPSSFLILFFPFLLAVFPLCHPLSLVPRYCEYTQALHPFVLRPCSYLPPPLSPAFKSPIVPHGLFFIFFSHKCNLFYSSLVFTLNATPPAPLTHCPFFPPPLRCSPMPSDGRLFCSTIFIPPFERRSPHISRPWYSRLAVSKFTSSLFSYSPHQSSCLFVLDYELLLFFAVFATPIFPLPSFLIPAPRSPYDCLPASCSFLRRSRSRPILPLSGSAACQLPSFT